MAKNKKAIPQGSARAKILEEQKYKNPTKSVWGKAIIAILALLMLFGGLTGLVIAIMQNF